MSFHNKINRNYGFSLEKINSQENLFHAIYFLDYETGALLVSNRFSNNLSFLKDDLICSFLNAINLFINEVKEGVNDELQEINFRDTRILYEREGRNFNGSISPAIIEYKKRLECMNLNSVFKFNTRF